MRTLEWKDIKEWQRDNEFILTGYRPPSFSFARSLRSIRQIHNETINIWSHLLGAVLFLVLLLYSWFPSRPSSQNAPLADASILAVFFSGVTICFTFSTCFHVFQNHSPSVHTFGNQLDHLGIIVVIWGSAIPSDYFGFYDEPRLLYTYWSVTTFAAIGCGIFTLRPAFRTPTFRPMRSLMYGGLGLSTFVPAVHGVMLQGWNTQNERMSITYFLGLGLLNGTGTMIYAMRIPERWYPRTFDIFGSSHQLMHVLVICGALSHTVGLYKAFEFWHGVGQEGMRL